jgi:cytochrome c
VRPVTCHSGNVFGDTAIPSPVGAATQWPLLRERQAITLQMRLRECLDRMGAAPFPAGSEELAHLDYFITYLSNGLPIRPNAWRP